MGEAGPKEFEKYWGETIEKMKLEKWSDPFSLHRIEARSLFLR